MLLRDAPDNCLFIFTKYGQVVWLLINTELYRTDLEFAIKLRLINYMHQEIKIISTIFTETDM